MKLFVLSETLTTGGAEWFSLRLAAALMKKGHSVYFFVLRPDIINERIVQKFPQIKILTLPLWRIKLLVQVDRVVKKLLGKNIFVDGGSVLINSLLKEHCIDQIIVSVIPVLLGNGIRLFESGNPVSGLKLVSAKSFPSGLVQLNYSVNR
mgnify:CR=1 FL=1